jgi:hypothetical protein
MLLEDINMKRFLILSHSTPEVLENMQNTTQEQMEEGMKEWFLWKEKYNAKVVDIGAPLINSKRLLQDGSTAMGQKQVSGYMMIEAISFDDVVSIIKDSPLYPYENGCELEIHEVQTM